ncbi:TPA: phage tail fiber protein [Klebsiella pneumoniae]|uniref:phage tail fiber domain-containing protein n=1 Tax=Klebsiella pneumoniae TaxID=573 RepID=UPI00301043E6
MTVSTQVSRNEYTGNGATTQYDFTFRILDKSHLLVQTLDTSESIVTLTLGTDYTVTGVNRYNGGKVVLTSALPAGYKISIERSTPVTQEASIRNQGGFFPEIHEDAFDKLTMLVQQAYGWWSGLSLRKPSWLANYYDALNNRIRNLRDPSQAQDAATKGYADNLYQGAISHSDNNFKRTLRVPESEVGMLPGISGRRKKILAFNDTGNPIAVLPESGSAADVMIELAAGDGASHIGGLNYVTPEMSGFVTGAGNADADTAAIQWALNQNAKQVVLDSTKTYNIQPGVIRYTGKINVDAGTAKIVCDGVAVDIIDGAGSVWRGGNLISKTIPWAVIYNDDWTIKEQGRLGYGRMPFQDATGIAPEYIYQDICCAIVFRSSDATAQDGLTVTGVRGSYASVIAAGFINTLFDDCVIRGGCNMGVISIINHTRDKVMFGYVHETSATNLNDFKWARGKNHTITNCTLFEGRAMGLNITGTDGIYVSGCNFIDNAESGVKFGQYTVREWTDTDICSTNINVTDCLGAGQWYDGFDMQNAYGSGSTTYLDQHLTATNCRGIGNRRTGIVGQGGYNRFISCHTERNGSHGLIAKEGRQQLVDKCVSVGNGLVTGGVDLTVIGIGSIMQNCQAGNVVSDAHQTYMINHQIGAQAGELYAGNYGKNVNNLVYNSSKVNLDPLVDVTRTLKATATDQVSELRGQKRGTLSLRPVARYVRGGRVDSEAGAMAAWEHPYSGAYLRFYTDDMSQLSSSPFVMSYNHGKNAANPNGYADNAGIGGLKVSYYPTSFRIDVYAAGAPTTPAGGASVGAGGISPTIDNQSALGATSLRWTQLYAANSTINTSDANHKTVPVNPSEAEMAAFYEIASLPWAWQWLEKYQIEGDEARLHSGPTVQAAIEVMGKHGLNWTDYSAFCYDSWLEETDSDGNIIPAGGVYSFRKEELLLWMLRATVERQKSIEARLSALESN